MTISTTLCESRSGAALPDRAGGGVGGRAQIPGSVGFGLVGDEVPGGVAWCGGFDSAHRPLLSGARAP